VLIHSWYLRRIFWSDDFEDIMAIIDEEEEEYEQPTITQIVHALVIYGLVVIVGFFLLIGLANKPEQAKDSVNIEDTK
jgi:hypothetical protein